MTNKNEYTKQLTFLKRTVKGFIDRKTNDRYTLSALNSYLIAYTSLHEYGTFEYNFYETLTNVLHECMCKDGMSNTDIEQLFSNSLKLISLERLSTLSKLDEAA